MANAFVNAKKEAVDAGELSPRTWDGYKTAYDFLVKQLGKARLVADLDPDDFAALRNRRANRYGPHGCGARSSMPSSSALSSTRWRRFR